jgi:hypothetical protein
MRRHAGYAVALAMVLLTTDARAADREELKKHHFWLGITTWASFAATTVLGTMRYANVVGFGEPLCAQGNTPILGREWGCGDGLKVQHLVSGGFTTASYAATRTLAALMPDSEYVDYPKLRLHRALSWVHLAGMIATPLLGIATAATDDPSTRDTLATVHLGVAYGTLAAISTAGALMAF